MSKFTVFGATGFIGRHLVTYLKKGGHDVHTPTREDIHHLSEPLGHVVYGIGLTSNFRQYPELAVEAHAHILGQLIKKRNFESWLYLSSTRVYRSLPSGSIGSEEKALALYPSADSLYDLSKLLGESICLGTGLPYVRVARLSNVYGHDQSRDTFLGSILADAKAGRKIVIEEAPSSSKDYISIQDVVYAIEQIALKGKISLYNVASGMNTSHQDIVDRLISLGLDISFSKNGKKNIFPLIDIEKIKRDFYFQPRSFIDELSSLFLI